MAFWEIEAIDNATNTVVQTIIQSNATRMSIVDEVKRGGMTPILVREITHEEWRITTEMAHFGAKQAAVSRAITPPSVASRKSSGMEWVIIWTVAAVALAVGLLVFL